jgi:hypothetical protein
MIIKADEIKHYGTPRHSGRYPWGSGEKGSDDHRNKTFLDYVDKMRRQGLTESEIAKGMGSSTTEFRARKAIASNAEKQSGISLAQRLKDKGMSQVEIGKRMGNINESTVRSLLEQGRRDNNNVLQTVSNMLKEKVDALPEHGSLDVGKGVENQLGISQTKLATAVAMLRQRGYNLHTVYGDQLGTAAGKKTIYKVLTRPETTRSDVARNKDKIQQIQAFSEDKGHTLLGIQPPLSISSKRVAIRYGKDGGAENDGIIYVRPGVEDVSIGKSRYAQVRVKVDGTHYLKGVAIYKSGLPAGTDLVFNTKKSDTGNKLDAMKNIKDDVDNPFGSKIKRQLLVKGEDGKDRVTSAMNIVNEEGDWDKWARTLSAQTLSKQSPKLAKHQLDQTYESKKAAFDEIMSLTNPAVRKKLLDTFAGETDASAVHLEAARLPKSSWHVILPMNSIKETEAYAPNFTNGTRVALVRYPHAGTFEIPELTVNNNHPQAIRAIGRQAKDAIGINSEVAKRLSGADFDGDAVLVIPNNNRLIKSSHALEGLKDFDPQHSFPEYPGMKIMDAHTKGVEMGKISNLITDMTIQQASRDELARAVRHSMVVIDAENHKLNYKLSAEVNGIKQLKIKYQGGANHGGSTLISRAGAETRVNDRRLRRAGSGGPVDKETGKLVFEPTNKTRVSRKTNKRSGVTTEEVVPVKISSKKLAETDDAHTLVSKDGGTPIEKIYADHSNKLKDLANQARKASVNTNTIPYSESAAVAYKKEVGTLNSKLNIALKNAPLERQAQVFARTTLSIKKADNPGMSPEEEKKIKAQALTAARIRTGAAKQQIKISDDEWAAIQAGAITNHKLTEILRHADLERVKELATPKKLITMTPSKIARAEDMLALGATQSEVADAIGVSLSTLKRSIDREEG